MLMNLFFFMSARNASTEIEKATRKCKLKFRKQKNSIESVLHQRDACSGDFNTRKIGMN